VAGPDAALPSQVIDLAVDVGNLVSQAGTKPLDYGSPGLRRDRIGAPEFPRLLELSEEAIPDGLESGDVERYLRKMGFDPSEYHPVAPRLDGPSTLGEPAARELRLEQAARLRDDLKTIAM